jgi:hypothetical protein
MAGAPLLPSTAYVRTIVPGESNKLAVIDLPHDTEVQYIRILFYKHGTVKLANEVIRMQVKIFPSDSLDHQSTVATSSYTYMTDIPDLSDYWWGWLRFDFNRQHLSKDRNYLLYIEVNGDFTPQGDGFIGFALDYPVPQNTQAGAPVYGAALQLYGYRNLRT